MDSKKIAGLIISLIGTLFILVGCGGRINYQGEWYGVLSNDEEVKITISKDTYSVQGDTEDKKSELTYQQTGQGFENKTKYIMLKIKEINYTLAFPTGKEEDGAVLIQPSDKDEPLKGKVIQVLDREDYPEYQTYIDENLTK